MRATSRAEPNTTGVRWCRLSGTRSSSRQTVSVARAAGLLDQEGDRVGLVDEPQPALMVAAAPVAGVEEDAAADQDAIAIGDQRRDPAHVEITAARPVDALQAIVDIEPHRLVPVAVVGGVDGEFLRALAG